MKGINVVIAAVVALVLLAGASVYAHDQRVRRDAVAGQLLRESQHREALYRDSLHTAKATFRADTVQVTKTLRSYSTIRDTIHLTDTVAVKVAFERADTAIHACTMALSSCAKVARFQDSVIASKGDQIEQMRTLIPTKTSRVLTAAKWIAAGAALGYIGHAVIH